jgi:CelD/BcsL family acetyltransferase involved in cellulose biosynthesis
VSDPAVRVSAVADFAGLRSLAADWRTLHRADPHATVFTSWPWMAGRLSGSTEWEVLVARAGAEGPVVGLLPLRLGRSTDEPELPALSMAGSPLADYTGFLCAPGFEAAVLAALAGHVRDHLAWRRLEIRDVLDSRLADFLGHFPEPEFRIDRQPPTPCPCLDLDGGWDVYLKSRMGAATRQTLRRKQRAIDRLPGLRLTTVAEEGERQIATLLELWQRRWGELPEPQLAEYRSVFQSCLAAGCLWLDILWDGQVPITGLLAFLDRPRRSFCFYITGFDERYAALSPGTVIVAHSIREAIRGGYALYDFLRGGEPYKFSFGARLRQGENVAVLR